MTIVQKSDESRWMRMFVLIEVHMGKEKREILGVGSNRDEFLKQFKSV